MPKPSNPLKRKDIEEYRHLDKTRLNNPQIGMVNQKNDPEGKTSRYDYDPHLDPTLVWSGKKEQAELDVDTVSIHVHERIDPLTIVQQVHKQNVANYQYSLFEKPFDHRPVREEVSFYQHKNAWANRLIAGDSLLVMNSLIEKEGMAEQVQMIYIDPPYGIKYGSNFQPYTDKRNVQDGKDDDLSSEPEMLKAFRDTWELGIHSYLSYMRDRLLLARELLSDTGSCFVQISNENVHHIRELLDEIFGNNNFVSIISYRTKSRPLGSSGLESVNDFIVWYKKSKNYKFRQLFTDKEVEGNSLWKWVQLKDGTKRQLTKDELNNHKLLPTGSKVYRTADLRPAGFNASCVYDFEYKGKVYSPPGKASWITSKERMQIIADKGYLQENGNNLERIIFLDDYPISPLNNLWGETVGASDKEYVVQTNTEIIKRCMLMCTDPGDLVLDPTCGSGTTAYVAEEWGRRWITIDTSRISIQIAKKRLMTSVYEWYVLAHDNEGVSGGFKYKTVPHVTLSSIANGDAGDQETLYNQPIVNDNIVRVSGPFTAEAIPAITVKPLDDISSPETADNSLARTGETVRQDDWRSELLKTGVRTKAGESIDFTRVELLQGTRYLHAEAETTDGKRVLISFGPDHAPLDQKQVELGLEEAGNIKPAPSMILFAAFQFDPEAAKDIDETKWAGVGLLKVQMNTDLLTTDLKKSQSSSESFWLVGQPDVQVHKDEHGKFIASVDGFDYYNPKSGEVQSGGKKEIAMWMLDTDYDGRSIFPTQVFFPMAGAKDGWNKLAKNLKAELDETLLDKFEGTESIAFEPGEYKRCAIKIIDNRGIESFCIKNLE